MAFIMYSYLQTELFSRIFVLTRNLTLHYHDITVAEAKTGALPLKEPTYLEYNFEIFETWCFSSDYTPDYSRSQST